MVEIGGHIQIWNCGMKENEETLSKDSIQSNIIKCSFNILPKIFVQIILIIEGLICSVILMKNDVSAKYIQKLLGQSWV